MLSKKDKEIKLVKKIEKKVTETCTDEVGDLLKTYNKSKRDIIQKHAETRLAVRSMKMAYATYFLALIFFIISASISLAFSQILLVLIVIIILIFIIVIILFEREPLQDIILKIECDKLTTSERVEDSIPSKFKEINDKVQLINMRIDNLEKTVIEKAHEQIESLILLNINEISKEVKLINSGIDNLEKTVIEKADIIAKEVRNLKKLEEP